ncbi:hypothetical protein BN946_scf184585.g6 [Trametes cinnabarina]|uniref:PWWP domain-containing protein n=1 Tax=Pycnoporus cinnabarinus TaxID=5643 RepID=A0A060STA3_PYCCI|nr:hypothetical protein BN946_scf184585.g6 [Trametes cinnabarina]
MSKKGAQTQIKEQTYEVRDIVLAKVRGFPPWPGMIVDPDTVPAAVAKERPNTKAKKGNWYCVRFFPAGDYAWIVPKDISRLQEHEIQAFINEPHKRSGDLMKGYRIALDPRKWEEERDAAMAEAQEEEANAEVDQLESDGEEVADDDDEDKKKKTRKRRRESDAAPAKTKTKTKKGSAEPAAKKRATSAPKGKKNGPKSKALVESEDDGGADDGEREGSGPSKRSSPPPAKKAKRDKDEDADSPLAQDPEALKVREWRHKLQKAFLNKALPKEEDMPALDQLFSTVERYDNMTIEYLTFSKIGKVMRHIYALADEKVPRDDEFKFRERAKVLVDKWHDVLKANGAPESKPATNGAAHKTTDADEGSAAPNGKAEENGAEAKENGSADMQVDENSKGEAEPTAAEKSVPEAESKPVEDAPANGAADESVLADVTMSEAAA